MKKGFSLVELSIVLVILGLLVGGILAGQSLIRAAELRSVTTQLNQFVAATLAFRDKYIALPGDMAIATKVWGEQHATPATCQTTSSTGVLTCNGNGDGTVGNGTFYEMFRFWQHLSNAGLIEGTYSGVGGTNTYTHLCGTNTPQSRLSPNSCWEVNYWGANLTGSSVLPDGNYAHGMLLGSAWVDQQPLSPLMKAEELWNIDIKMDDGKPITGNVVSPKNGWLTTGPAMTCTTTNVAATANYDLSNSAIQCFPVFRNLF